MNKTVKAHVTSFGGFLKEFAHKSFSEKMLVFLYLFALVPMIYLLLNGLNTRIGLASINEILPSLVMGSLMVLSLGAFWKRLRWWDVVIVVALFFFYFYSINIYPATTFDVYLQAPVFILTVLPYYLIGASVDLKRDSNTLLHIGRIGLLATLFLIVVGRVFNLSMSFYDEEENMGRAYQLLVPLLLVIWNEIRKPNLVDLILAFIGLIMLLGFGTRGPVLSLVVLVALMLIIKTESVGKRVLLVLGGLLFYLLMNPIISFFGGILSLFGMSDRVVSSIADTNGTDSSGRDKLWEDLWYQIQSNSPIGEGLYSDRSFVIINNENTYAHNIYLEWACNFGIVIATILMVLLLLLFIKNAIKLKGTETLTLWFAILCFGFVPLLISDSYLERSEFWFMLGACIAVLRTNREYYSNPQGVVIVKKKKHAVIRK